MYVHMYVLLYNYRYIKIMLHIYTTKHYNIILYIPAVHKYIHTYVHVYCYTMPRQSTVHMYIHKYTTHTQSY